MRRLFVLCSFVSCLAPAGCGGEDAPVCNGPNGPCIEIAPGPDGQTEAQTALIEALPGDIILFRAGVHSFTRDLSLDVDGVTVRGEGMDATILSFAEQTEGAQGVLVTADNVVLEDLAIEDAAGDGLKVEGTSGLTIRRVRAEWTGGPSEENGAYGLYPVQCTGVLIEDSLVKGASDAGIYVGQSTTIVVRNNRVEDNVAGIEIENSNDADVYGNVATGNTGGLLIFNLPGLQVKNGARTRAFGNEIYANNTENFAPAGNIVGIVPRGTGVVVLAGHQIELFDNDIRDNLTVNMGIISYLTTDNAYDDPEYDPYSDTIYVHDNTFGAGGEQPTGLMGALLLSALLPIMSPVVVPSIVFDGDVNPDKAQADNPQQLAPAYNLCFQDNGDAGFANLDVPGEYAGAHLDASAHDCVHPALAPVVLTEATGAGQ